MENNQILFYASEFYCFSNFSAFNLDWKGLVFNTSEAAYQWEKFPNEAYIQCGIQQARSAHDAFKIARKFDDKKRSDWDEIKLDVMKQILFYKVTQHDYVMKKLLQTGTKEIIEDSWRDDYWGWGADKKGHNHLGKLWMEIREELKHGK